ncbi:MAG TPA: hypothetical protein VFI06_17645, partial [Chitinophagaceae bacterium]|nr:hypothetical protein [Chitinophagaceae bacterium]
MKIDRMYELDVELNELGERRARVRERRKRANGTLEASLFAPFLRTLLRAGAKKERERKNMGNFAVRSVSPHSVNCSCSNAHCYSLGIDQLFFSGGVDSHFETGRL